MMQVSASLSPTPATAAGWLRLDFPLERRWGFTELVAYARRDLPPDPHDPHGVRFRAYARGVMVPPYHEISWLPPRWEGAVPQVAYWQALELNAEVAGRMRRFATFPRGLLEAPVIADTVREALGVLLAHGLMEPFRLFEPWLVGVHLVKLSPQADRAAESSPPWVHRDGEPYTFVILLDRHNVVGGVNVVCPTACATRRAHLETLTAGERLACFVLERPGDAFLVVDERVSHGVSPVVWADPDEPGWRMTLLVDFTPLEPRFV